VAARWLYDEGDIAVTAKPGGSTATSDLTRWSVRTQA